MIIEWGKTVFPYSPRGPRAASCSKLPHTGLCIKKSFLSPKQENRKLCYFAVVTVTISPADDKSAQSDGLNPEYSPDPDLPLRTDTLTVSYMSPHQTR